MVHKIHKIAIVTDDIEGAVRFYTEKLGLTEVERFENEDDGDDLVPAGHVLETLAGMKEHTPRKNSEVFLREFPWCSVSPSEPPEGTRNDVLPT